MQISTPNLKVASALTALGVPLRQVDPVIRVRQDDGTIQNTFWLEGTTEQIQLARQYHDWFAAGEEHPLYYIRAALENRERLLDLMHRATVLRYKQVGPATLLISERASQKTREILRRLL